MKKLSKLRIWSPTVGNKSKRPKYGPAKINSWKSYDEIMSLYNVDHIDTYIGMMFNKNNRYIGIDVDVDPSGTKKNATKEIPMELKFFLAANPTHTHYSPSGNGIHIIYYLSDEAYAYILSKNLQQKATGPKDLFKGDIRFHNSFLTFTPNIYEDYGNDINKLSIGALEQLIPSLFEEVNIEEPKQINNENNQTSVLTFYNTKITDLEICLETLPTTYDYIVERAFSKLSFTNKPTSNYDYWVFVGFCCAHTQLMLELVHNKDDAKKVYPLFLEWSKKDIEGFISSDDVYTNYLEFYKTTVKKFNNNSDIKLKSIVSLKALHKICFLDFPDKIYKGNGKSKQLIPAYSSERNFAYLCEFDSISVIFDSVGGGYCFKGPEKIMKTWFCVKTNYTKYRPAGYSQVYSERELKTVCRGYLQNRYKNPNLPSQVSSEFVDSILTRAKTSSAFKLWIEDKEWDGVERFDQVCRSLTIQKDKEDFKNTYYLYIKKMLLATIGIHYFPEDNPTIPAIVILTGPQHTYKSTWVRNLLPYELNDYQSRMTAYELIGNMDSSDLGDKLTTNIFVEIPECEALTKPIYEDKLKSIIDAPYLEYRNKYSSNTHKRLRSALLLGTTNKSDLFTGTYGTRKILIIPIDYCDSYLLDNMDRQQLYAEIAHKIKQFKKRNPNRRVQDLWAFDKEMLQLNEKLNKIQKGDARGVRAYVDELFGLVENRPFDSADYVLWKKPKFTPITTKDLEGITNTHISAYLQKPDTPYCWSVLKLTEYLSKRFNKNFNNNDVLYALQDYSAEYTESYTVSAINPWGPYNKTINRGLIVENKARLYLMPNPLECYTKEELICMGYSGNESKVPTKGSSMPSNIINLQ